MCGIIGIASNKPVSMNIINSLKKLEYRGYDSAGLATLDNDEISEKKYEKLFINHNINSRTGSLYRILNNDDIYVEEEDHGRILRGDSEGNLRWEFIWNSLINWSRYISEEEFKKFDFIEQECQK